MLKQADDISHVVIAGAGTMGVILAQIFARHGYSVTLYNHREPSLERAKIRIASDLDALAADSRLKESPAKILSRLDYSTSLEAFRQADFVVENIAEDLKIKQEFFRNVCQFVPDDVVLATNTSGLRVSDLASAVTRPERFCGMHWWNPPHLIPLVEITKGDSTGQEAAEIVQAMAARSGKKPVIVQKDILGIIGNRLQYAVLREAIHIMELGAAGPKEIDDAMKYGPGFRYSILGPLETVDLGGLDIFRAVSNYLFADLADEKHSQLLNELADDGRLGVKSGRGFYEYAEGEGETKLRWRNEMFQKQFDLLYGEGKNPS